MPQPNASHTDIGHQPDLVSTYRTALRRGQDQPLDLHVFRPKDVKSAPLLIWYHAGGFRTGRIVHASHRVIARWLTAAGIAVAFPEYRLGAATDDLEPDTKAAMQERAPKAHPRFPERFRLSAAMAAMEDGAHAFRWLEAHRDELGIKGPIVLGGSSAGAVTALNLTFLAPDMGWDMPAIGGVVAMSGAFAFPELVRGNDTPVMSICNPEDDRMPSGTMLELARQSTAVNLHMSDAQEHGSYRMSPEESKRDAFGRLIRAVEVFSGSRAEAAE